MSLHLSHLILSHFRSHRRTELMLGPEPVAIFGPNGAGKTNLLEAVSLFSPGRGLRRANSEDMTRRPEAIGWKVTGTLQTRGQSHEISFQSDAGAPRSVRIDDKSTTQSHLGRLARVLWLVPAMDRLWIEGAEGRRRFLDRMTLSFVPGHGEAVLSYEKAMRDRNRLLKDQVRDAHWYAALENQMAQAAAMIQANRDLALSGLTTAQANAVSVFPVAELALTHPDTTLPRDVDALRAAWADGRRQDMYAARTLIGPHRVDLEAVYSAKNEAARDCSTGEQKALLISIILANARAIAQDIGSAPILLLDEVAAHLDPDRRSALYREITELGAQVWMTGTEPGLFEALGNDAQYLEVTSLGAVSKTGPG